MKLVQQTALRLSPLNPLLALARKSSPLFLIVFSLMPVTADEIKLQPLPLSVQENYNSRTLAPHVLTDPGYRIWGVNVIKWTDGKYHAFYSRWKEHYDFHGWLRHSEIAHAVSDSPEGPFKTTGTILKNRNADGWDLCNAHNPAVCVADGKILIYYISNDFREDLKGSDEPLPLSEKWITQHWEGVRDKQRIGLAIADNPAGPFTRHPVPVVEPDNKLFKNIAVNPAVHYKDGRYTMIMKGDSMKHEEYYRIQLVGHSSKPEGPFTFQKTPIYTETQSEDACIWYNQNTKQYNTIIHIFGNALARLQSDDGITWRRASPFLFTKKEFKMEDGSIWKPTRVERPFVLTDDQGTPIMLYLAAWDRERSLNANLAVPLKSVD